MGHLPWLRLYNFRFSLVQTSCFHSTYIKVVLWFAPNSNLNDSLHRLACCINSYIIELFDMGSNRKRFKKSHNERSIDIIDFKSSFKYFKSKNPPPDMNQVIDADNEKFQHLFSSCASESSNYFEEESHNPHLCKNIQDSRWIWTFIEDRKEKK